jgi:(p)ppGpp synthase/HD superfamily hydrolase
MLPPHAATCCKPPPRAALQEMLVSGLLHDTVEDTDAVTLADIGVHFGAGCQRIVEGETKFSKLSQLEVGTSKEELKARSLRALQQYLPSPCRLFAQRRA